MSPKPVSKDMQSVLTHVAGALDKDKLQEMTELLRNPDIHASYLRCTWWGGCYYCQDENGFWHLIYCYAEPDLDPYQVPSQSPES